MSDEILINDVDIENVKKEFEIYINKIATVNQYLKNELEASFVLLSVVARDNPRVGIAIKDGLGANSLRI